MANICINITEKDFDEIKKGFRNIGYNLSPNIDIATIKPIIETLIENKNNPVTSDNWTSKENEKWIRVAIDQYISEQKKETDSKKREINEFKIAGTDVGYSVLDKNSKLTGNHVAEHKDRLYVFADNMQAFNAIHSDEFQQYLKENFSEEDVNKINATLKEKLIIPKRGITTNVSGTSAMMRTDNSGKVNTNAIGFVTKLNAQNEEGKFDTSQGNFTNEEGDLKLFEAVNRFVAKKIKTDIEKYKGVSFIASFATKNASMPKENIEILQNILMEELGIETMQSNRKRGLTLVDPKFSDKKEKQKEASEKLKEKYDIAQEYINSESPAQIKLDIDNLRLSENILSKIFPNITERKAITDSSANLFVDYAYYLLEEEIESLKREVDNEDIPIKDRIRKRKELYELTSRSEEEAMSYFFNNKKYDILINGKNTKVSAPICIMQYIVNTMKESINSFQENDGKLTEEAEEYFNDVILSDDRGVLSDLNAYFNKLGYSEDKKREAGLHIWKQRNAIFKTLLNGLNTAVYDEDYTKSPLILSLMNEMSQKLEFDLNIKFSINMENVVQTSEDLKTDDEQGTSDNRSGLGIVKYGLVNPNKTLSPRIKQFLSSLPYTTNKGAYVLNSLGFIQNINGNYAYYILLQECSKIQSAADFFTTLQDSAKKYPWINTMLNSLNEDISLRNEMYRAVQRTFVPAAVLTTTGIVKQLNRESNVTSFINKVLADYESGTTFGDRSIYNIDGTRNADNLQYLYNLLVTYSPKSYLSKRDEILHSENLSDAERNTALAKLELETSPYSFIDRSIQRISQKFEDEEIENLLLSLQYLRGEYVYDSGKTNNKGSLQYLLKNLGIDPTKINVEGMIPSITREDIEAEKQRLIDSEENVEATNYDALLNLFTEDQQKALLNIFKAARTICMKNSDGTFLYQEKDHLIEKLNKQYRILGKFLAFNTDGFTLNSYTFKGNQRYSYLPPCFVDRMVDGIQSKNYRKFLNEEYKKYDFFLNHFSTAKNTPFMQGWLKDLYENKEVRDNFTYVNLLGSNYAEKDKEDIQSINDEDLLNSLILAFYQPQDESNEFNYGYYRFPSFSDFDTLFMIKAPAFLGSDYKNNLIKRLSAVFWQEYFRIKASEKHNGTIVENFNDKKSNAEKFNFFPWDKETSTKIFKTVSRIYANEGRAAANKYIQEKIKEVLNSEFETFYEDLIDRSADSGPKAFLTYKKQLDKEKSKGETENAIEEIDEESNNHTNDSFYELDDMGNPIINSITGEYVLNEEVKSFYEKFFWNDYYSQTQITMMTKGDLAFSKNHQTFVKRNMQVRAVGERIWDIDEDGNELTNRAIYIEDYEPQAFSYDQINELLNNLSDDLTDLQKDMLRGKIANAVHKYNSITATDGQSLRSIESIRKLYTAMGGKISEDLEEVFNNIEQGRPISPEDIKVLVNSIKPFCFSSEALNINGRTEKVTMQYKNSEALISALLTTIASVQSTSPVLLGIHKFMKENNIDVVHFHSVVKEGYTPSAAFNINDIITYLDNIGRPNKLQEIFGDRLQEVRDLFKGKEKFLQAFSIKKKELEEAKDALKTATNKFEENNALGNIHKVERELAKAADGLSNVILDNMKMQSISMETRGDNFVHETPFRDYMIMQPTDDHWTDTDVVFPSQGRNILPADLPSNFSLTVPLNGQMRTLNREESILYYNMLISDQLLDSYRELTDRFKDIDSLHDFLVNEARKNPKYGKDVVDALEIETDTITGKKYFTFPFNNPNLTNKIDDLIYSSFRNNITRQTINGGSAILLSNIGLSDRLHIKWNDENDPTKGIDYIPAYLPAWTKTMFKDFLVEDALYPGSYSIDFDKLEKNCDPELLRMVGFRIPTENKYSIMNIKVIGFLPEQAGTTIMLPTEIITMSGTDFDIDKLFIAIRNFERIIGNKNSILNRIYEIQRNPQNYYNGDSVHIDSENIEKLNKILSGGVTEQKIAKALKEVKGFSDFWDNFSENYMYETPYYRVMKPYGIDENTEVKDISKLDKIKDLSTRKKIRDNMIIDVMQGIMSSPSGSRQSMMPGQYDNLSKASTVNRILNNKKAVEALFDSPQLKLRYENFLIDKNNTRTLGVSIQNAMEGMYYIREFLDSWALNELDDFYNQFENSVDPNSVSTYINDHRNLMEGNSLIGAAANNSSRHQKLQNLDVSLTDDNQFKVVQIGEQGVRLIDKIDQMTDPITGELLSDRMSEYQAAAPDNGKDPRLGYLGVTLQKTPLLNFLLAAGFNYQTIGFILTSESLTKIEQPSRTSELPAIKSLTIDFEQLSRLAMEIERNKWFNPNEEQRKILFEYAVWYKHIKDMARALNSIKEICFSDSTNNAIATDSAEVIRKIFAVEKLSEAMSLKSFPFKNLDKLIDTNFDPTKVEDINEVREFIASMAVPRMQAAYSLGIKSAETLATEYIPVLSQTTLRSLKILQEFTGLDLSNERNISTIKTFLSELTTYLLSGTSIFGTETDSEGNITSTLESKRNYYIEKFPQILNHYKNERDSNGELIHKEFNENPFIKHLSIGGNWGIIMSENSLKITEDIRKQYREGLEKLVFSSDPKEAEIGLGLILYGYYNNGLNFRHNAYSNFISSLIYKSIPEYLNQLKDKNKEWNGYGNEEYFVRKIKNFVYQYILNHPKELRIKRISKSDMNIKYDMTNDVQTVTENGKKKTIINKFTVASVGTGVERRAPDIIRNGNKIREFIYYSPQKSYYILTPSADPYATEYEYRRINVNNYANKNEYIPYYNSSINMENDTLHFDKLASRGAVLGESDIAKQTKKEEAAAKKAAKHPKISNDDNSDLSNLVHDDTEAPTEVDMKDLASQKDSNAEKTLANLLEEEQEEYNSLRDEINKLNALSNADLLDNSDKEKLKKLKNRAAELLLKSQETNPNDSDDITC